MPAWDGTETLRRLRGLNPSLPVVVVSGEADSRSRLTGLPRCVVLAKPYSAADLIRAVASALQS
jgi:CheY-like chemotaxis protein